MSEIASAYVSLLPSAKGFGSKMESQVGGEVNSAGKRLGSGFGKLFAISGGLLAAAGIGSFLKDSIAEAREAQKVGALTTSVIKATGGAANVTADQVGKLAGALSLKTGIDDEVIQSGQNMLLTFKNVRNEAGKGNDIFSQSTKTLIDMSAAMGTEPKQAAIQLGKALNDPVKGISALSRVGVTFTEGQKDTIKALVAGGDTMKAQKIILGELNSEFGGAAAAQATAGDKAKVALGNLKEQVGTALLPLIDKVASAFVAAAPKISKFIDGIGPAFAKVKAFLAPFVGVVMSAFGSIKTALAPAIAAIQGAFGSGGQGSSAIASFVGWIKGSLIPAVAGVIGSIRGFIAVALPIVQEFVTGMKERLGPMVPRVLEIFNQIKTTVIDALTAVKTVIQAATDAIKFIWSNFGGVIMGYAQRAFGNVITIISGALDIIQGVFRLVTSLLKGDWRGAWNAIKQIVSGVWQVIKGIVSQGINLVRTILAAAWVVIKLLVRAVWSDIKETFSSAWSGIKGIVKDGVHAVVDFVKSIPGKIKSVFSSAGTFLLEAGKDIIRGLINGIKSMAGAAADAAKAAVKGALDGAKSLLGIHSPSTKFAEVGKFSMLGLKKGIDDNADKARDAMIAALKKSLDVLESHRDKIKGVVDQIKSDMGSLKDSVSQTFAGNLFDVSALASSVTDTTFTAAQSVGTVFANALGDKRAELTQLLKAFKKLKGWGLPPQFLSQLFASGNSALILEMAGGSRGHARQDAQLFGQVQSLSNQLGGSVASNQYGPELRKQTQRLERVEAAVKNVGRDVARALNQKAADAQRKKK